MVPTVWWHQRYSTQLAYARLAASNYLYGMWHRSTGSLGFELYPAHHIAKVWQSDVPGLQSYLTRC
jgi:hypothetical protein